MNHWKKHIRVISIGLAVAMFCVAGVNAFQKEDTFVPQKNNSEIQENHVVFHNKNKEKSTEKNSSSDSDLWEKDKKKEEKIKRDEMPDSSALFENQKTNKRKRTNNYKEDKDAKKIPVRLNTDQQGDSKGKIRISGKNDSSESVQTGGNTQKQREENTKQGTEGKGDSSGQSNQETNPGQGENGQEGKGGDSQNSQENHGTRPTTRPSVRPTATPTPTAVPTQKPVPPEQKPAIPSGDRLVESMYPGITDYPKDGVTETTDQLHIVIFPIFDADRKEYIYYNAELTKEKLLCSIIVYVANENNQILYRLTDFSDNFQIGEFPAIAQDDFTVTYQFRQNKSSEWTNTEYTYTVLPFKFFIMNENNELIGEEVPDNGKINLFKYNNCLLTEEQKEILIDKKEYPIRSIIENWTDEYGQDISDQYTAKEKGWKALYPGKIAQIPSGYEAKLKWHLDLDHFNYCANLKYLQTLTKIPDDMKELSVMKGIQWVDLGIKSLRKLELSDSVAAVSMDGLSVRDEFVVNETNPYFTTLNGVLLNKDQTEIVGIPVNTKEIEVPKEVEKINIPENNNIQKLVFSSENPPEIDLTKMEDVNLWVPNNYYDAYYAKWHEYLSDNVKLRKEDESEEDYTFKNGAILSKDETILYRLDDTVEGNYIVPKSVKVIKSDALAACKNLYQVTIPGEIEDLEKDSLCAPKLKKVVILGKTLPLNSNGKFVEDTTQVYVTSELYAKWRQKPVNLKQSKISLESADGFTYLHQDSQTILLDTPKNQKGILEDSFGSVQVDEIAWGAFSNCNDTIIVSLPESVKTIRENAFLNCKGLQGILVGSRDEIHIEKDGFGDCSHIRFIAYNAKKAVFDDDYCPTTIGFRTKDATGYARSNVVKYNNYELTYSSYFFLEGTPDTGMYLYADFYFSETQKGTYLAGVTDNIKGTLALRKDIQEILFYSFENCQNEFYIDFSQLKNLFSIGEHAFMGSSLKGDISFPDSIQYIAIYAFSACKKLERVKINGSLIQEIPMYVFSDCDNLKEIDFDSNSEINMLEGYAFSGTAITKIEIPKSVSKVYSNLFLNCENLVYIEFQSNNPPELLALNDGNKFVFENNTSDYSIVVPKNRSNEYKTKWKEFADRIQEKK